MPSLQRRTLQSFAQVCEDTLLKGMRDGHTCLQLMKGAFIGLSTVDACVTISYIGKSTMHCGGCRMLPFELHRRSTLEMSATRWHSAAGLLLPGKGTWNGTTMNLSLCPLFDRGGSVFAEEATACVLLLLLLLLFA